MKHRGNQYLKGVVFLLALFPAIAALSACFSPWRGDTGTFSISFGSSGRALLPWNHNVEIEEIEHVIKLSGGPGLDQTRTITGAGTAEFIVVPGKWQITVEAYWKAPYYGPEAPREFVAYGTRSFDVKSGPNGPIRADMWQVVKSTYELPDALGPGASVLALYAEYPDTWDIDYWSVVIDHPVTLIAISDVEIYRASAFNDSFFAFSQGGSLTLQTVRGCTLTLNGSGVSGANPLIDVDNGGKLFIYDGVRLVNNDAGTSSFGGAVRVTAGSFAMYGGTIAGNRALTGGGVYVTTGGTFTKTGGVIYGDDGSDDANIAINTGNAVYVAATTSPPPGRSTKKRDSTAGPGLHLNSETAANWE